MKKLLTLILALLLVASLSMPAMAFTSDTQTDDGVPYDLKIYLVEYDDNDFFGIASLPESDRGYAKNEIVAAVVELVVPEDEEMTHDDYAWLELGGENVDLNVADNYDGGVISLLTSNVDEGTNVDTYPSLWEDSIWIEVRTFPEDTTYKWLFFAKVTGDDASLFAELADGYGNDGELEDDESSFLFLTLDGEDYYVNKTSYGYEIYVDTGDYIGASIYIDVDEDNISTGMSIKPGSGTFSGTEFALGVNTKNELGIMKGAVVDTDGDDFDDVMDIYNDVVVDVFGMDYFLIGNYVRDSYFENLVSADTITATVDITPWTAYVTVPDNIVVDPPKTGDAASIMGFVMVALSGAGVVALRKRG